MDPSTKKAAAEYAAARYGLSIPVRRFLRGSISGCHRPEMLLRRVDA